MCVCVKRERERERGRERGRERESGRAGPVSTWTQAVRAELPAELRWMKKKKKKKK